MTTAVPEDSNILVLPAKKKGKKKVASGVDARGRRKDGRKETVKVTFSKKQRKRLERKQLRKEKKIKRADVIKQLSSHKLMAEEHAHFESVASLGSRSRKRHADAADEHPGTGRRKVSSLAGASVATRGEDGGRQFLPPESDPDSDLDCSDDEDDGANENTTGKGSAVEETQGASEDDQRATGRKKDEAVDSSTLRKKPKNPLMELQKMGHKLTLVRVQRTDDIETSRSKLPVIGMEQEIMEAILENDVVIISAETGSGKTTQVPQFLYEAGFSRRPDGTTCLIGVTEPRRVAAISMSSRVATELSLPMTVVSFQIRYEGCTTDQTEIKFMTDGVLLREIQSDFLLSRYSVIVIDEAHERSMYSDILIGLLSRIIGLRRKRGNPLKLVIMSATLRIDDFTKPHLFHREPKLVHVDSRQFPVTVYFNRVTPSSYLDEAYTKVVKIHRTLPPGGILVFVSGQAEISTMIRWLATTFPPKTNVGGKVASKIQPKKRNRPKPKGPKQLAAYSIDNLTERSDDIMSKDHIDAESESSGSESENEVQEIDQAHLPLHCLPLFSMLSTQEQQRVFQPPPDGTRLCVVATNVAETSLTIPNVSYVVDTGKVKNRKYDQVTGVSQFVVEWISQASANQRAGRAGRMGPGHCYRLYSSAVFNDFPKFTPPEITEKPVDELVLQMKSMGIAKCANFPFPSPPDSEALVSSEDRLLNLGALEEAKDGTLSRRITELGRTLTALPLLPQYGKILALSHQHSLLPYAIALVSGLSVRQLLFELSSAESEEKRKQWMIVRKRWLGMGESKLLGDMGLIMKALCAAEYAIASRKKPVDPATFCNEYGIRYKAFVEARKLRKQLTDIVNSVLIDDEDKKIGYNPMLEPPSSLQARLLRQIVFSCLAYNTAKLHEQDDDGNYVKRGYQAAVGFSESIFVHPSSVFAKKNPEYVIYQQVIESANGKKYMHNVCVVDENWFPTFAAPYCTANSPCEEPEPYYDPSLDSIMCYVEGTFGPRGWSFPASPTRHPLSVMYYRHFCRFMLDGTTFPALEPFSGRLLAKPETVVKSWAHLQRRSDRVLASLAAHNVTSKRHLVDIWDSDPTFLLEEYLEWVPESLHSEVRLLWPPVYADA